jgi:hypothetical protein
MVPLTSAYIGSILHAGIVLGKPHQAGVDNLA